MLDFEVRKLREAIRELGDASDVLDKLEPFWRGPALRSLKRTFSEIFRHEGATRRTAAWRRREGRQRLRWGQTKLLQGTGRLRRSYVSNPVVHVGKDRMSIGSNVPYAKYHEHGTRYIPARPVVGYAAVLAPARLQRALNKYLRKELGDGN